jgi:hypothetical protein
MAKITVLSLNGEDTIELVGREGTLTGDGSHARPPVVARWGPLGAALRCLQSHPVATASARQTARIRSGLR